MTGIRIDLMRHGKTEGGERYRGSTDDVLSPRGWEQMRVAVGEACPWTCIISSPLKRCAEFAVELAQRHALPLELDARLQELHFGAWEGKTSAELLVSYPAHLARFWNDPLQNPPPGAEPLPHFEARVLAAWNEHLAKHTGKQVLIITHGGPIRMIVGHIRGLSWPERLGMNVPHATILSLSLNGCIESPCTDINSPPHFRGGVDAQRTGWLPEGSITSTLTAPTISAAQGCASAAKRMDAREWP